MQIICCSTLPIYIVVIVENEGLRNFVSVICPRFKIKSRTFYTRFVLNSLYQEYKCKVIDMLSTATSISFTTDSWSSEDNKHSLLSMTAHFVGSSMWPRFAVTAAAPIKGRHTTDELKSLLAKAMAAFDVDEEKVHLIVRDAASTMRRTTNLLVLKSVDCFAFAHKLQLERAVKDGLKALGVSDLGDNSIISRLLKIVKKIRESAGDKDALLECQNICEIPESSLVKVSECNIGHGNTVEQYVRHVTKIIRQLESYRTVHVDRADYPKLDTSDWALMKKLLDSPTMRSVKEVIAEGLKMRMEDGNYEETEEFVIATMVDPRFRDSYFDSEEKVVLLKKLEETSASTSHGKCESCLRGY
ncbi:unnamed protein product [Nippostrongylus brasiliensis]|uniref:Zinc finger BED domain-containing protein 4 n=1 Tax=Nippostrongylus brasiliensis TaxID=27835 RepID=A0A0N4XJQ7_NIPBR|nr:unnamed protein product [Nippostrongylus brasiliensis]